LTDRIIGMGMAVSAVPISAASALALAKAAWSSGYRFVVLR